MIRLLGELIVLREWEKADAPASHAWAHDPDIVRFTLRTSADLLEEAQKALAAARSERRREYRLAIEGRATGDVVGSAVLFHEARRHRRGEIGYFVRADQRGKGFATETARLLLELGFGALGLHRIWATCDPTNAASRRVLAKIGMAFEGRLREHYRGHDGAFRDELLYAILRAEWT